MRLAPRTSLLVCLTLLITTSLAGADERAALNAAEAAWVEAIHAGDRERILSFWTDDAIIYMAGGKVVEGKPAIEEFVRASRDSGMALRIVPEPGRTVVSTAGDLGYTIGTYEFRRTGPGGETVRMPGRHLCTWRRGDDGSWRCMLEMHTPTDAGTQAPALPATPTPTEGDGTVFVPGTMLMPCHVRTPSDFDADESYDLVIGLHGYGDTAEAFTSVAGPFTEAGMLFAVPTAPTPILIGNRVGYKWNRTVEGSAAEAVRDAVAKASQAYVLDVVRDLRQRYNVRRVFLLGFSQGGGMSYVTGIQNPDVIAGIVVVGMGLRSEWFEDGVLEAGTSLPILVAHSPDDERVPLDWSESSVANLQALGYDVTLVRYAGGHWIPDPLKARLVEWLRSR